jgi:hypothetical protein
MRKFSDYIKEQNSGDDESIYDVNISDSSDNLGFSELNSEIIHLLREIRDGESDVQDLMAYDSETLSSFITMALDYGLFNPILKNN